MKKLKIIIIGLSLFTLITSTANANQCREAYQRTISKQRNYMPNSWQYNALNNYKRLLGDLFLDSRKYPHALRTYEQNCINIYNQNVLAVR